jgi:tetratricopeptide (TPR) repeat protein
MKKFAFASVMAFASLSLVSAPTLRAQDTGGTISVKDPVEYQAFETASTQSDPKAKAAALEDFLTKYPQTVLKKDVTNMLLDSYQQAGDQDNALKTANRLLQLDPNDTKAIFISVYIDKQKCQKGVNVQTGVESDPGPCDDAATLAVKGLAVPKPSATADPDWQKQTAVAYPLFHDAEALDDAVAKKDYKGAVTEYSNELKLYPPDQTTTGPALVATLNLAEAYAKQTSSDATINAIWYYARAVDFAPANYKPIIEKKLDYWYNKYHGAMDGLDAIKTQAQSSLMPPAGFTIAPAPTPAEKIHTILTNTPDLATLALADKELVLAYGSKDDADKLWAIMKDKDTPVPGVVIEATATTIKMAVTDDAKQAKTADFIVNLKAPLPEKEIPAPGFEYGLQSAGKAELDGTYDSYTQIPGTDTVAQSAQIVLRDGSVVPAKRAPVHKPAASHRATTHQ